MIRIDAPLVPSPGEGESLLRRELLRPEYHAENPVQQLLRWIGRQFESGLDRASSASPLGSLGAIVVFLAILLVLGWLVARTRPTPRVAPAPGGVLTGEPTSAAALRERATAALDAGDAATAVVEGFRALTMRQIELGALEDQPGATAHEVSVRLGTIFAGSALRLAEAADLFDAVLYGEHPASPDQAAAVLALGDSLAGVRR